MMLNDLQVHERMCQERTIKCSINNCGSIVKLKDFNEHAFNTRHSIRRRRWISDMYFHLKSNDIECNNPWTMFCVQEHNVLFHVCFAYYYPQDCFALSVCSSTAGVVKYRANLKIMGDEKEMSMSGLLISSVENVPSIDKCMEKNGKYVWCIPSTLAFEFSIYKNRNKMFMLHVDLNVTKKW